MIGLGIWQLQRLEWKEGLIEDLNVQLARASQDLSEVDQSTLIDGMPVHVEGKLTGVFTDIVSGGSKGAGYRRLAALKYNGKIAMVELGFIGFDLRQKLDLSVDQNVFVQGNIFIPKEVGFFDRNQGTWAGYDVVQMAQQLKSDPIIIVARHEVVGPYIPFPYDANLVNNHFQYAITWFLFAFVWLAMSLIWGYSRIRTLT